MATLQTSGAISILHIKNLFGGPTSPALSNYYRGGSYIPATKTITDTVYEGPYYSYYDTPYYFVAWNSETYEMIFSWADNWVYFGNSNVDSVFVGGYTYFKGSMRQSGFPDIWEIGRSYTTSSTVNINTGIPSSGTISLSNFYGAEKP